MSTFFSGTDQNTLKQEGNDKDNFFSLIVNNAGTYSAGITVKMNDVIENAKNVYSFTDFDGSTSIYKEDDYNYKDWLVHWSEGTITKEIPTYSVDFTDRINEIKESKKSKYISTSTRESFTYKPTTTEDKEYGPLFSHTYSKHDYNDWYRERYLGDTYGSSSHNDIYEDKFIQLLTLNLFASHKSKLNLRTFVRFLPQMITYRFKGNAGYYNILESFMELVFDDFVMDDIKEALIYIINRANAFQSNSALDTFKEFLGYYLETLNEEESNIIDFNDDPYHWRGTVS